MSNLINPPQPQSKRKHIFCIRLTLDEHKAIKKLATQMKVTPSHLARHFLMQIVEQYTNTNQDKRTNELTDNRSNRQDIAPNSEEFDLNTAYRVLIGAYIRSTDKTKSEKL